MEEVGGLQLENAPRVAPLGTPDLPTIIPFIDHGYRRSGTLDEPVIALSLYEVVNLATGQLHIQSREKLAERFLIPATAAVVLSGVDKDHVIERWWELSNRSKLLNGLREIGIILVTSPNYGVLNDVPRTDNHYAIKRILLAWTEITAVGLPAALHVNARTEHDYNNWADLIRARPEIDILAFEFATSYGRNGRINWHVEQLCRLARLSGRPLELVIRGGGRKLTELQPSFQHVALLETDSFFRTHRRRRAYFNEEGRLRWRQSSTPIGEPLDDLLAHNIALVRANYEAIIDRQPSLPPCSGRRAGSHRTEMTRPGSLAF